MKCYVQPAAMQGQLQVPPSKSYLLRAAALALLTPGESIIHNVGHSEDEQVAISLLRNFGAEISFVQRSLKVRSTRLLPNTYTLSCGESALALRLFASIAALLPVPMQLRASGTLCRRPQHPFEAIFPPLGVLYESTHGHAPLFVQGPLRPANLTIDAALSSQFATGLLIAYVAAGAHKATLSLRHPVSKPYLSLTLELLARFGCQIAHTDHQQFHFTRRQSLRPTTLRVPGDWSSAAYLLVAAALSGTLVLSGLAQNSPQADKYIVSVLQQAQCRILYRHRLEGDTSALQISANPVLAPVQCDLEHSPDLFPAVAALAAFARGSSYLSGVHRLVHKESNRAAAIQGMLKHVGIPCEKKGDTLCIHGQERIKGGVAVSAKGDHRMVMMAALLALRSQEGLYILGAQAVSKSFPDFFSYLKHVGIPVREVPEG